MNNPAIHGEDISPNAISIGHKISLIVPTELTDRRLYLYVDTKSTGDFILFSRVLTMLDNSPVDQFSSHLFYNPNATLVPNKSVLNYFAVGGSAVGDAITLQLAAPFNVNLPSVVMQPLRINGRFNRVVWEIESFSGQIQGYRAALACMSSKP